MATDGDKITSYLNLDISGYQKAMEEAIQLMKKAGKEGLTTGERISGMGAGIQTMGKQMTTGAEALAQLTEKLPGISGTGQQIITTISDIMGAIGPLMNIGGTLMRVFSNPVGWIALLAGAGVAGAVALNNIRQAAIQADLEARFGDIALSAEEMDEAINELFADDWARHMPFSADLSEAQQTLNSAVEDFNTQDLTLGKMLMKADLGLDVDAGELQKEAAQLALHASDVIRAQKKQATLNVKAVFGEDDPDGEQLIKEFNAYYDKADATATQKGLQLAEFIEKGMQKGFLDETDMATIEAIVQDIDNTVAGVVSYKTQAAQKRFEIEAKRMELTPESIIGLQERANESMQTGIDEINVNHQQNLDNIYGMAAAQGWSDEKTMEWVDKAEQKTQENILAWEADTTLKSWQGIGQRVAATYDEEINIAEDLIAQSLDEAHKIADYQARQSNLTPEDEGWADAYADAFKFYISDAFARVDWSDVLDSDAMGGMGKMYEALRPQHETIRELAAAMGDELPQELRDALNKLNVMEMLSMAIDPRQVGGMFAESFDVDAMLQASFQGTQESAEGLGEQGGNLPQSYIDACTAKLPETYAASQQVGQAVMDGMADGSAGSAEQGDNAIQGFLDRVEQRGPDMDLAGYRSTRIFVSAMARGLQAHSPSRATAQLGTWGVDGFVGSIAQGLPRVIQSGINMAKAVVQGAAKIANYIDWSKAADLNREQLEKLLGDTTTTEDPTPPPPPSGGSNRSAAAEAARQQALVDGIRQTAAATLAADQAAYQQRMNALNGQYQSLMSFAGSHAIWYQDDKGETEVKATKKRYDDLIEEENKRYEAEKERIEAETTKKNKDAQQQRLDALKEAHEDRAKLLKEQRDEETEAMKKQYSLQKEMATDWLNSQKSLLSAELSAKRAAYAEDDYQDELADLQKRQRQSKSARERRELQEQIDKMIRDHALEAEEAALQETLAGYDALIKAVGKGLIGLGDLTGSSAYGELSFGTAGLSALDNLTAQQLQNVMASLDRGALSGGVGATVSSAQMAAALRSASGTASAPVVVTQEGRNYTIDLRGAIVRDDSDIDRIMDEMDRRLRAAGR